MSFLSLCPDDPVLSAIRKNYSATPLKTPETRIRPLGTFSHDKKKKQSRFLGDVRPLLIDRQGLQINTSQSDLSEISSLQTRKMNVQAGFDLLNGFLKKLGAESKPLLTAALGGIKQLSFSFVNVKRDYVDTNELGSVINKHKLDLSNLNLHIFKNQDSDYLLMLIDSVLTANEFEVHRKKERNMKIEVNQGILDKLAADVSANLKVKIKNETDISFESPDPLTFAITNLPLIVNWQTGAIEGFGVSIDSIKSLKGQELERQTILGTNDELLLWDN